MDNTEGAILLTHIYPPDTTAIRRSQIRLAEAAHRNSDTPGSDLRLVLEAIGQSTHTVSETEGEDNEYCVR